MNPTPSQPVEAKQSIVHPELKCPTCQRPRELKVDKPGSLAGATKGVRVRPLRVDPRKFRSRKRMRDKRDIIWY